MASDKKKLPYEPPKIFELEVDMAQAMGQSVCTPSGSQAGGSCNTGNRAGGDCSIGNRAGVECDTGNRGRPPSPVPCMTGPTPA